MSDAGASEAGESKLPTLEAADLLAILPHRFPFLLVDRIIEIRGDESCIGIKSVSHNEPFFPGHFPGRPVMPGVLILEGMAQTAGAICAFNLKGDGPAEMVLFLTIDKAKFRRPVLPGDRLAFHMAKIAQRRKMWWFRGEAKVDGKVVCEAELGAMIADK